MIRRAGGTHNGGSQQIHSFFIGKYIYRLCQDTKREFLNTTEHCQKKHVTFKMERESAGKEVQTRKVFLENAPFLLYFP